MGHGGATDVSNLAIIATNIACKIHINHRKIRKIGGLVFEEKNPAIAAEIKDLRAQKDRERLARGLGIFTLLLIRFDCKLGENNEFDPRFSRISGKKERPWVWVVGFKGESKPFN